MHLGLWQAGRMVFWRKTHKRSKQQNWIGICRFYLLFAGSTSAWVSSNFHNPNFYRNQSSGVRFDFGDFAL
jgi:hypothetical protein